MQPINRVHSTVDTATISLKAHLAATNAAIDSAAAAAQQSLSQALVGASPATVTQVHIAMAGVQIAGRKATAAVYSPPTTTSRVVARDAGAILGLLKSVAGELSMHNRRFLIRI